MIIFCPALEKVGTGTSMLKEFGAKVVVVAAPELTTLASLAAVEPGKATVLPPEMLNVLPLMLKLGVEEIV